MEKFSERKNSRQFIMDFQRDYYKGPKGIYFNWVLKTIIEIGNLRKNYVKILDFGCGTGKLKKLIPDRVINYDIHPKLSEIKDWRDTEFDVVVVNQVFYLMYPNEIRYFLRELYKLNPQVDLIIAISERGVLNNMLKYIVNEKNAHADTKISPEKQLKILQEKLGIVKKKSVFFMCNVFLMRFSEKIVKSIV